MVPRTNTFREDGDRMPGYRPPSWASKTVITFMFIIAVIMFIIIVTGGITWE